MLGYARKGGEFMAVEYVCSACGGRVSEAEYQAGKTVCQTPGCVKNGQPFERREMMAASVEQPKKKHFWKFW